MKEGLEHALAFIQSTLERVRIHAGAIQAVLDEYCQSAAPQAPPLSEMLHRRASEQDIKDVTRDLVRTRELIRQWAIPPDIDWALGCCCLYEAILSLGLLVLRPGTPELYGQIIASLGEAIRASHEHHSQAAKIRQVLKQLFDEGVL